jgi:hypothetical protein
MFRTAFIALIFCLVSAVPGLAQSGDARVATALLPLPDTLRSSATVVAFSDDQVLRRGTNGLTCLTDRPGDDRLSLVCYPSSIEAYMRRGRELAREGVQGNEYWAILGAELRAGTVHLPAGVLLRNVSGPINSATGVPDSVRVWSEILLPFADATETGIPQFNAGLDPWLMSGGTVGAHVMIRYRTEPWEALE